MVYLEIKGSNLEAQKKKAVGIVEKVYYDPNTDAYFAHSRVTDPKAREYILKNWDKKLAVSPQLIYDSTKEPSPNYYKNAYEFSHLSLVEAGAYGPSAVMIGKCSGTGEVCHKELEAIAAASASSLEKKDKKAAAAASLPAAFLNSLVRVPPNGKRRGVLA